MPTEGAAATPLHTMEQLTEPVPGAGPEKPGVATPGAPRRFKEQKPVLMRLTGAKAKAVLDSLDEYRKTLQSQRQHFLAQYRALDVAFKVVGTGSVGLRDYWLIWRAMGRAIRSFCRSRKKRTQLMRLISRTRMCLDIRGGGWQKGSG